MSDIEYYRQRNNRYIHEHESGLGRVILKKPILCLLCSGVTVLQRRLVPVVVTAESVGVGSTSHLSHAGEGRSRDLALVLPRSSIRLEACIGSTVVGRASRNQQLEDSHC